MHAMKSKEISRFLQINIVSIIINVPRTRYTEQKKMPSFFELHTCIILFFHSILEG